MIIKYGINGIGYKEIESNHLDSFIVEQEKQFVDPKDLMEDDEDKNSPSLRSLEKFDGYEYIDSKTVKTIKKKIEQLEEQKERLEKELNFDEVDTIDTELDKLNKYLDTSLNIKGERRKTNTELQKIKRRVKKAINEARKQIKEDDLKLFSYIEKSIVLDKNKNKYFYVPDSNIDWVVDQ